MVSNYLLSHNMKCIPINYLLLRTNGDSFSWRPSTRAQQRAGVRTNTFPWSAPRPSERSASVTLDFTAHPQRGAVFCVHVFS